MKRLAAAALALSLLPAAPAAAHGIAGKEDLPIPGYLFGWAAAVVLVVSFVGLAYGWREPRLAAMRERHLVGVPAALEILGGALGVALFGLTVYAGLAGTEDVDRNLAPSMIFIGFWVGTVVLSIVFGDVFAVLSPWRAVGRGAGWLAARAGRRRVPRPYPERLGQWPAAAGLLAFAWLELACPNRTDPRLLAILALVYAAVQLVGMARFGERPWSENADGFGVYFGLLARLAPLHWARGRAAVRWPGVGAAALVPVAGTVAVVLTSIGSTTFDGFSSGALWPDINGVFGDGQWAHAATATIGLLLAIAFVSGFYRLGLWGIRSVDESREIGELARLFVHTLIPIAAAYVFAHYFTLLTADGQQIIPLLSDPLGHGSDLFGTAGVHPNLGWISSKTTWYIQVAALLAGHVTGLVLAHDRALELYPTGRAAARSQYWMLVVMVGFTSLGLWLLSLSN